MLKFRNYTKQLDGMMRSNEELMVDSNTAAIRFWARTGCDWKDNKFVCQTGDCGAPLNNFGI